MSIKSIFSYIDNKSYIINNEISVNNYFKGDIKDYYDNNENLINLFKEKYGNNIIFPTEKSIIIRNDDNDYKIFISYKIENDELYWTIKILS